VHYLHLPGVCCDEKNKFKGSSMSRIANKSARLQAIEALLLEHPEGLTLTEIAVRLGVHRSTISRNLLDSEAPIYEADGRLFLDRKGYLLNLRLTLHEALSLHLAARLLAANLDRQNAHAAAALRKISQATCTLAPQISRHIARSADRIDELAHYDNPSYMRVLETLTEGWAQGKKVRVWHRRTPADPLNESLFSPYYIEPGAWGRSTYVIGLREPPGEMRTLKIERIEQAELLRDPYTIPDDFDPFRLLADAWGIWYTEEEPVEVVLQFSPRVAARVLETHWHHSQRIDPQPDGSLIWRAKVAEPREMMYWVRGWGLDVKVLQPESIRIEMVEATRAAAEMYGWTVSEKE
jgi:CRISPR-associated endonuclease/helicase Cas3